MSYSDMHDELVRAYLWAGEKDLLEDTGQASSLEELGDSGP